MSQDNVEIVRAAIEAYNRGDWEGFLEHAVPGFELDLSRATGPEHGVYGFDQTRRLLEEFGESWESLRIEGDEFIEAGEDLVTPLTMYARGRDGIEVPSRVTWVWTIRDGAIVRACMYQERRDALEAVGAA
jgi:ketosteroid isomerase-like protein